MVTGLQNYRAVITFVLLSCQVKKVGSFVLRFHILWPK